MSYFEPKGYHSGQPLPVGFSESQSREKGRSLLNDATVLWGQDSSKFNTRINFCALSSIYETMSQENE